MELTSAQIAGWIASFVWPLARIGAALGIAPVFGARTLPARARLALALGLTWAVLPFLPPPPPVDPLSAAGVLITAQELLLGLGMGFLLRLAFGALEVAGQVIAMQMGLGFALLVDPQNSNQLPLLSAFYNLAGVLIFLALNGHLVLVGLLAESFQALPVGGGPIAADLWSVAAFGSQMFAGSVLVALPAIASLLVVNLSFGVMSRAAPQFNIFAVGFPISLLLGLLIILYGLPGLLPQMQSLVDGAAAAIRALGSGAG